MIQQPTVITAGSADRMQPFVPVITAQGLQHRHYATLMSDLVYVGQLADNHAAMILVDGGDTRWRFWLTVPRTNPATRRIPLLLVTADDDQRRAAVDAGADFALSFDEALRQLPVLLAEDARLPNPDQVAELDCQCQEALPPLAQQGVEQFNAGEYYHQHDLFEAQWMAEAGPVRDLYRAILQVGVAYYQITRGNHRGALKMLLRSIQWLTILPDVCQGVDVAQLRRDSDQVRTALEGMTAAEIGDFDLSLLKPVRLVGEPKGE